MRICFIVCLISRISHWLKKYKQNLESFPEQRRGARCWLLCILAAFHAGDKILERQASGFILCSIWKRINQHQVCFQKYAPTFLTLHLFSLSVSFPNPPSFCVYLSLSAFLYLPPSTPSPLSLSLLLKQSPTSFYLTLSRPSLLLLFFIPSGRATVLSGICWIWWA